MAGISPISNTVVSTPVYPTNTGIRTNTAEKSQSSKERNSENTELADVIATSRDGDTVQAGKEALTELADEQFGRVILPEETESAARKLIEQNEQAAERKSALEPEEEEPLLPETNEDQAKARMTSFTGYTDDQLTQLYLKGEISKSDYDKELTARADRKEAIREEENRFSKTLSADIGLAEKAARDGKAIDRAFSDEASDTIKAEDRLKLYDAADELLK